MSTKFTPGPWMVDKTVALGAYGVWKDVRGTDEPMRPVCSVYSPGTILPREERDANAALIAAAPDLLEACKAVLPAIYAQARYGSEWDRDAWEAHEAALRAAIARAEHPAC